MDIVNALETLRQMCCMAYYKNGNDCGADYESASCSDSECGHYKFCKCNSIVDGILNLTGKKENKPNGTKI